MTTNETETETKTEPELITQIRQLIDFVAEKYQLTWDKSKYLLDYVEEEVLGNIEASALRFKSEPITDKFTFGRFAPVIKKLIYRGNQFNLPEGIGLGLEMEYEHEDHGKNGRSLPSIALVNGMFLEQQTFTDDDGFQTRAWIEIGLTTEPKKYAPYNQ